MWNNLAKIVERYVHTGDKLYVEGRIRYISYDDKKGQRRYVTEINAENIELLSPRSSSNTSGQNQTEEATTGKGQQDENVPF